MKENRIKQPWTHCNPYSPETTLFDTYLEERKSQTSSPNTIVHKSPMDLHSELRNTMKNLQEANNEIKTVQQFQKFEFRKNLLKIINKDQGSNKETLKQVLRTLMTSGKNEGIRKKMINALDSSDKKQFFVVFNELGQNHPPTALYELTLNTAFKLVGDSNLPESLTESSIRFSLKFDSVFNKFKVIKGKSFADEFDAIILR